MAIQSSLFEPSASSALDTSMGSVLGLIFGELALGLCVVGVAFAGLSMLTGRLDMRRSGAAVVGCFILIGAPAFASFLLESLGSPRAEVVIVQEATILPPGREPLPPKGYSPYAQASVPSP